MDCLNIVSRAECTGCGMCKSICPKRAVDLVEDGEGFLYPCVDRDLCISCGLCEKYCPVKQRVQSKHPPLRAYSFYLDDREKLMESASGGAVTALASATFRHNGAVYACSYLDGCGDAGFSLCESDADFRKCKSSIYFNTQPMDQKFVKELVGAGRLCMAVGLPCQLAALRNYVGETDNLVCVSLICGGQEPRILHRKVLEEILSSHPGEAVSHVNYRYKKKNWNTSCLKVDFKSGASHLGGGPFRMAVLRESCYACMYKIDNSFADIIVGDFWGCELLGKEHHNEYGTSVALALTENGRLWMERTSEFGVLREVPLQAAHATNKAIAQSRTRSPRRDKILFLLKDKTPSEVQKEILGTKGIFLRNVKYMVKGMLPDSLVRLVKRSLHRCLGAGRSRGKGEP